jgi:hypothetical protein
MVSRVAKILFADHSTFSRLATRDQGWIRRLSGYAAGMALGFSDSFWNEALIPNFVTFTTLLFTAILWLLLRWLETGRRRICWWAFLLFGLLLTNAQEMISALPGIACAILLFDRKFGRDLCLVLLPVAALVTSITQCGIWEWRSSLDLIDWPLFGVFIVPILAAITLIAVMRRYGTEWKSAIACTVWFILGFALYLYLPIASRTNPPVNWAYSKTLEGFMHLIDRGQYEHIQPVNNVSIFAGEVWQMIRQTTHQFGWPYVAFAIIPFGFLPRMTVAGRKWIGALVIIAICVGPLLAALLNVPGDSQSQGVAELYFFPLRVPIAVCAGIGMIFFATKMAAFGQPRLPQNAPDIQNLQLGTSSTNSANTP